MSFEEERQQLEELYVEVGRLFCNAVDDLPDWLATMLGLNHEKVLDAIDRTVIPHAGEVTVFIKARYQNNTVMQVMLEVIRQSFIQEYPELTIVTHINGFTLCVPEIKYGEASS